MITMERPEQSLLVSFEVTNHSLPPSAKCWVFFFGHVAVSFLLASFFCNTAKKEIVKVFRFFFYELQLHAENVLNLAKRPVQSTSSEMFPCIRFAYVGRKQKKKWRKNAPLAFSHYKMLAWLAGKRRYMETNSHCQTL